MPSEWLPVIFGGGDEPYGNEIDELNEGLGALMLLYNRINEEIREERVGLPADLEVREEPLDNLGPDAPLGQWSLGFAIGFETVRPDWEAVLPEDLRQMIASISAFLFFFADRETAEDLLKEGAETSSDDLPEEASRILAGFEEAMAALARSGQTLGQFAEEEAAEPAPQEPIRRDKIGRNEPCSCGSGKKYKKCCRGA
jgi:uncharacterized protein YecA (UPF0149 family)